MNSAIQETTLIEERPVLIEKAYQARAYAAQSPGSGMEPFTISRREPGPQDVQIEIVFYGIGHSDLHQEFKMKKDSIFTRGLHTLTAMALSVFLFTAGVALAADKSEWDKTFPQSEKVTHRKVSFSNRLGIDLVGDLYVPKSLDSSRKAPAIVVGPPFGGVKEQTAGLYAQQMAERGFVTLAFDPSYNGESGGRPRSIASPEALVEDFSAAVDFLGTQLFVDRERIGVIGVCGSGGFGLAACHGQYVRYRPSKTPGSGREPGQSRAQRVPGANCGATLG